MKIDVCVMGQPLNKKAFTLIELLAVIVILAIIALIATPIILGIINDAKKQSNQRSAELYLKAAELAIARENLNGELNASSCEVQQDGNLKCNGKDVKVEMDGEKPKSGNLTFSNGKVTTITNLQLSDKFFNKESTSNSMVMGDTPQEVKFSIYRNSRQYVAIGESIVPGTKQAYCGVVTDEGPMNGASSCVSLGMSWATVDDCNAGMEDVKSAMGFSNYTCNLDTIPTGLSSYKTEENKSEIEQDYYLKHDILNNEVVASYACIRYNETEDICVIGGDPSKFSSNVSAMTDENLGLTCDRDDEVYVCRVGTVALWVIGPNSEDETLQGVVSARYANVGCNIDAKGTSYCE